MPRDKGSTCAPGAERTSVLWRMSGCTIGSSAAWQERDGRGSAQTLGHVNPLVAVVSANRCDEMCRHAATRCWLAVCVHNTRATPPRLRACATITRTCPRPSARLGCIQVGEADDETSRQRGVWDVPEHQRRPVVAQKGRSGGHSGEDHGTGSWTSQGKYRLSRETRPDQRRPTKTRHDQAWWTVGKGAGGARVARVGDSDDPRPKIVARWPTLLADGRRQSQGRPTGFEVLQFQRHGPRPPRT